MKIDSVHIESKISEVKQWFTENCEKAVIAFSGGVDSCLVAFLARKFMGKEKTLAVIADSPSLKRKDLQIAKDFCAEFDINLEIIHTQEIENPNYT
jgi:uncharacterized protein